MFLLLLNCDVCFSFSVILSYYCIHSQNKVTLFTEQKGGVFVNLLNSESMLPNIKSCTKPCVWLSDHVFVLLAHADYCETHYNCNLTFCTLWESTCFYVVWLWPLSSTMWTRMLFVNESQVWVTCIDVPTMDIFRLTGKTWSWTSE